MFFTRQDERSDSAAVHEKHSPRHGVSGHNVARVSDAGLPDRMSIHSNDTAQTMLSPETLEQYRRMTPGQRLALTLEMMQAIANSERPEHEQS